VTGWIAYGLSRATRRSAAEDYPAVHDRRHTVNVVVQAPGPFGSELAARLGYGSPLPYTPFIGEWDHRTYRAATHSWDNFDREPIASDDLNSARLPYYGRFDVSLRWEVRKWGGVLRPYVQVANMLNRRNVFIYFYDYTTAPATRSAISQRDAPGSPTTMGARRADAHGCDPNRFRVRRHTRRHAATPDLWRLGHGA
jgi:hypothetical protein